MVRTIVSVVQELVGWGGSEGSVEVNAVDGGNGFAVACDVRPAQLTVLNQCTTLNTVDSVLTRRFSWRKSELEPDVNETIIVHRNSVNFARGVLYDGEFEESIKYHSDNEIVGCRVGN